MNLLGKLNWSAIPFDQPIVMGASGGVVLVIVSILAWVSLKGYVPYLWREWITSVDHKRIGIMYIILALTMLLRGFADAIMMRAQQALAAGGAQGYLPPEHFDQIFSAHGTIMIFFMAMPFVIGMMNFVALSELQFSPGVGVDYYLWALQISGVGTLMTGINFVATILKTRAPGMSYMRMPVFCWTSLAANLLIVAAFPVLTATLAMLLLDRYLGFHFFTTDGQGNAMMYVNLFWVWGHPEVYILVLPAFGIFSEVVSTFSGKPLFGYRSMVAATMSICVLSFIVWLHHFFTMGAGANVNGFFGVMTMIIAVPTGVKVFNWLFTMYGGRVRFEVPILWSIGFMVTFVIGGMTGVLMAVPPADFQLHNSLFLIAHFHNVIIGGTVFGLMAGYNYWFPKAFGFQLDESRGHCLPGHPACGLDPRPRTTEGDRGSMERPHAGVGDGFAAATLEFLRAAARHRYRRLLESQAARAHAGSAGEGAQIRADRDAEEQRDRLHYGIFCGRHRLCADLAHLVDSRCWGDRRFSDHGCLRISREVQPSASEAGPATKRVVVGYGFWIFLLSDIVMFSAFFAGYAVLVHATAGGPVGAQLFNQRSVAIETGCLLASSYTCGLMSLAIGSRRYAATYLAALITFVLGVAFLALELREFASMIAVGAGPQRSAFLSSFFTIVGCHGLHVTAGLVWLAVMMAQVAIKGLSETVERRLLCFSLFWHALDIVWVWLFTVVYLMGVLS